MPIVGKRRRAMKTLRARANKFASAMRVATTNAQAKIFLQFTAQNGVRGPESIKNERISDE